MPRRHTHKGHRLRIGRYSEFGRIYLVTTVTRHRQRIFNNWDSCVACARALHGAPSRSSITPLAWVVMPDHLHWLFGLHGDDLASTMRRFKSCSAQAVNRTANRRGPLWQAGYHDHAVRREVDVRALARYVVANPLRAGLCERIEDYPFWDAAWL